MIVPHPISFQIFVATSVGRKYSGSAKKYTGSKPKAQNVIHGSFRWRQHDDNDARQYNPGEKWGIYEIDCATRLNLWERSSFNRSARRIGAGNPKTILYRLISAYFEKSGQSRATERTKLKMFESDPLAPHIPLIGLKSLNASWMPYNGP